MPDIDYDELWPQLRDVIGEALREVEETSNSFAYISTKAVERIAGLLEPTLLASARREKALREAIQDMLNAEDAKRQIWSRDMSPGKRDRMLASNDTHRAQAEKKARAALQPPHSVGEKVAGGAGCSICGGIGFIENNGSPEQRWACPECEARSTPKAQSQPGEAQTATSIAMMHVDGLASYPEDHKQDVIRAISAALSRPATSRDAVVEECADVIADIITEREQRLEAAIRAVKDRPHKRNQADREAINWLRNAETAIRKLLSTHGDGGGAK
jgi:hypothetical protein